MNESGSNPNVSIRTKHPFFTEEGELLDEVPLNAAIAFLAQVLPSKSGKKVRDQFKYDCDNGLHHAGNYEKSVDSVTFLNWAQRKFPDLANKVEGLPGYGEARIELPVMRTVPDPVPPIPKDQVALDAAWRELHVALMHAKQEACEKDQQIASTRTKKSKAGKSAGGISKRRVSGGK